VLAVSGSVLILTFDAQLTRAVLHIGRCAQAFSYSGALPAVGCVEFYFFPLVQTIGYRFNIFSHFNV
jgi:hypothetical protein